MYKDYVLNCSKIFYYSKNLVESITSSRETFMSNVLHDDETRSFGELSKRRSGKDSDIQFYVVCLRSDMLVDVYLDICTDTHSLQQLIDFCLI